MMYVLLWSLSLLSVVQLGALSAPSAADTTVVEESLEALLAAQQSLTHQTEALQHILGYSAFDRKCPYPFVDKVMYQCFHVSFTTKLSWPDARKACRGMGGDLATPKHQYALNVLVQDKYSNKNSYWVGGSYHEEEEEYGQGGGLAGWQWLTGEPIHHDDDDHWREGRHGDDDDDDSCVVLDPEHQYPLFTERCRVRLPFICQLEV